MVRTCTICGHPDRANIDQAILAGESYRRIAARYGVSDSALRRHQKGGHIPVSVIVERQDKESERGETLSDLARRILRTVIQIMDDALTEGDRKVALMAADRVERYIKLLQDMGADDGGSITDTEEWSQFISVIGELQDRHPDAAALISARLEEVVA